MRLPAMPRTAAPPALALALALLSCANLATSQTVEPTNDTAPADPAPADQNLVVEVHYPDGTAGTVDPLAPAWGRDPRGGLDDTTVGQVHIRGDLVLTDASTFNNLSVGDIALISCDPEGYQGEFNLTQVIGEATTRVRPGLRPSLLEENGGAIVLYSLHSARCSFAVGPGDGYGYQNVFAFTNSTYTEGLLNFQDSTGGGQENTAYIHFHDPNSNDNSSGGSPGAVGAFGGPAPTTTIAMVILYVITGMITLLFLVIIISGAVRAHRHPERYRNRTLLGRPVQGSRARGLAAAMLDTLPIVKFGEREDERSNKPGGDVEMQNGSSPSPEPGQERSSSAATTTAAAEAANVATADAKNPDETTPRTTAAATATAMATEPSDDGTTAVAATAVVSSPPSPIVDVTLACSVCTDDFVKGQDLRVLPCNHKFHPECIDPWLLNVSGTCPLCRVDLRPPEARSPPASPVVATNGSINNSDGGSDDIPYRQHQRRSGTLSTILHRALNRQHMSSATPAQRLEALRDLRRHHHHGHNHHRGDPPPSAAGAPSSSTSEDVGNGAAAVGGDERSRRERVGSRLSRFLGRDRPQPQASTAAEGPTSVPESEHGAREGGGSTGGTSAGGVEDRSSGGGNGNGASGL